MCIYDFELDPLNGRLYRKGKLAGTKTKEGYYEVRVGNGKRERLHRVIYQWVYGAIPDGYVVDHKEGNVDDNRPWMLQAISQSDNVLKGKCGTRGHLHHIYEFKDRVKRWSVQIKKLKAQRSFANLDDAIAYRDALLCN